MLHMLRINFFSLFIIFIFVSLFLVGHAQGEDNADPALSRNVTSALEKGRAEAKKITLPVNKHTKEGLKAAEKTAKIFHATEFQDKIQHEKQRLKKEVFGECAASWKKKQGKKQGKPEKLVSSLNDTEKVYLFLSSSIPDEIIHNYLADIIRISDHKFTPVMRGMVNGLADRKANIKYFSRILKKDMDCRDILKKRKVCERFKTDILFQPPLFIKYGIERVPALVYDNGGKVFLIQGDAGLDYLLERINREAKQESLESLISKIRGETQ